MKTKKRWQRYFITLLIFGIMACQSLPQPTALPNTNKASQLFKIEQQDSTARLQQQSLLALQYQPSQWRWVQTDPLGSPLARVILTPQGWQNDGFIMPNSQAKWLFSAIATALYPNSPLFHFSAVKNTIEKQEKQQIYFINDKPVWIITGQSPSWQIVLRDNSRWQVTELN